MPRLVVVATLSFGLWICAATAQEFPARQIRMVVPYPAGGTTDVLARIVARQMQAALGQSVIVESKPGASGAVGTREVARAAPDGHTLVLGTNQTHVTNAFLLKEPGYDALTAFAAIAGIADLQHALVVPNASPAKDVGGFIALAKREPGKLNYGSSGVGSASHLAFALFMQRTGIRLTHVAFRGAAPMALEVVAGRIDAAFATLPSVLGQIEGGEMRALALASDARAPQLPSLPLMKEQGVASAEADAWLALFAPSGTPQPVIAQIERVVLDAMARPEVRESADKVGFAVNLREAVAFTAYWRAEVAKWGEVVSAAGLKAE